MNGEPKIHQYKSLRKIVERLRDDLRDSDNGGKDFVLLFAYNGTGKTRLSMEFKETGKRKERLEQDTLYFNAFTEDLFFWDNDLANDTERVLKINSDSKFFDGFKELALEEKIFSYLNRYATFNFKIDYDKWTITFSGENSEYIKVSRGEENIFIWCIFLAVCELAIDGAEAYKWVKYFYIDDPISSLDDNNAIAVASDLAQLLKDDRNKVKTVISTHHGLFFNVICNELRKSSKKYFLHRASDSTSYSLRSTGDTPFFHHVATLSELQQAVTSGNVYTYHFNMLRNILEKTAAFFGYKNFSACIHGIDDEKLFSRALNLLSHGKYSIYDPIEMSEDNKKLFKNILNAFLKHYTFDPDIINANTESENQP